MDHISGRKFFPKVIYVQNVWQKQEKIKFSETSLVKDKRFNVVIVQMVEYVWLCTHTRWLQVIDLGNPHFR